MIEFGKTLQAAREAKGLSIGQLAEMTRMAPTTVRELEAENFTRIAAPIYGRGFVKLYCEAVGIDPKPLVAEFMDLYNGNRDAEIKERPPCESTSSEAESPLTEDAVSSPCAPEPPVADPISACPVCDDPEPTNDLFHQEPEPIQEEPPPPAEERTPHEPHEPTLSRYAAPVRQTRPYADPRVFLRLGILAVGTLALLVCLLYGIRTVYRATTPRDTPAEDPIATANAKPFSAPPQKTETAAKSKPTKTPEANAGRSERTPQKIPSLYID